MHRVEASLFYTENDSGIDWCEAEGFTRQLGHFSLCTEHDKTKLKHCLTITS